jgi:hypothetical protein
MKKILILIISMAVLISCSKDGEKNPSQVKIRLSNISQYDYQNIVVNTSTGNINFENLNSGQKTAYKVFEKAYRYAFVELEIDGKTYTLQPVDYVGETALDDGNYTYQIDANDPQEQFASLSLELIKD